MKKMKISEAITILNITNYNSNFFQLGQEIFVNSTRTLSTSAKSKLL